MKLKRFLLRYYPPGVILEYELRDKSREMKEIDLLHLTASADVDVIVNQIVAEEPLISESKKPHLRKLLYSKCLALFSSFCGRCKMLHISAKILSGGGEL